MASRKASKYAKGDTGKKRTRKTAQQAAREATKNAAKRAVRQVTKQDSEQETPEPEPEDTKVPCLVVVSGKRPGCLFKLQKGVLSLGSVDAADVVIEDTRVSGVHCRIYNEDNHNIKVEDADSTNGTYMDSARIYMQQFTPDSLLHIGRTLLRLEYRDKDKVKESDWMYPEPFDEVTGVMSRYFFLDRVHEEWNYQARMNGEMFLLMVGIDNGEYIRESFGQKVYDYARNQVATVLYHEKRREDVLGSYNEDVLAIMPRGGDKEGVIKFSDRLLRMIQNCPVNYNNLPVPMIVSIGVAGMLAENMNQFSELLNKCENCRHTALERGGNQIAADIV